MGYGLAILTFVPSEAPQGTRCRLKAALHSLRATNYSGPLVVVDDGSTDEEHLQYLTTISRSIDVVRRPQNGGIALAKNTCLRVLRDLGVDVGFIAEDDIEFREGWLEQYRKAHQMTGIHHFSWGWDHDPCGNMRKEVREIRGYPITATSLLNGVFLSFTRTVIDDVGGFKVLPAVWGHEHTNWTRRIIAAGLAPHFSDVVDSNKYVHLNAYANDSAISQQDRDRFAWQNQGAAENLLPIYHPLLE